WRRAWPESPAGSSKASPMPRGDFRPSRLLLPQPPLPKRRARLVATLFPFAKQYKPIFQHETFFALPNLTLRAKRARASKKVSMVLSCREVWKEISNYLEGEVNEALRADLEAHFTQCRHC